MVELVRETDSRIGFLMGMISTFGRWLDMKFPDQIPADEVYRSLTAYTGVATQVISLEAQMRLLSNRIDAYENGARAFDKELTTFKDKLNTLETVMKLKPQSPVTLSGKEPWKR